MNAYEEQSSAIATFMWHDEFSFAFQNDAYNCKDKTEKKHLSG